MSLVAYHARTTRVSSERLATKTSGAVNSVGLDIIEQPNGYPSLGKVKSWDVEQDVVMNCELLYFGHSVAPYHIESTFLVTADGAEVLQTMPEALRLIG